MSNIKTLISGVLALFVFAVPAIAGAATLTDEGLGVNAVSNYTRYPGSNSNWFASETANPGDVVSFGIYYYNQGPGVAQNVVVRLTPPGTAAQNSFTLTGTVSSSNSNTISGPATINIIGGPQTLTFNGVVNWDRNSTVSGFPLPGGANVLTSNGVALGDLAEGEFGTIVVRFSVGNQQQSVVNEPTVTTNAPTNVGQNACTFNATVDARGNSGVVTYFQYGTTQSFGSTGGNTTIGTGSQNISFTATNLSAGTTYFYRAVAQRPGGAVQNGSIQICTTQNVPVPAVNEPTVQTLSATNITQTSATLNGFVDARGTAGVTSYFEYGTTQSFGSTVGFQNVGTGSQNISTSISNLSPNTTYFYRAVAQRPGGPLQFGGTVSFTTAPQPNLATPFVTTQPATQTPSDTTWILNGSLNSNGFNQFSTVFFQYGDTPSFGSQTSSQSLFNGSFSSTLSNLVPGRTYYFRAMAQGTYGTVTGNTLSFTVPFAAASTATQVTTLPATNRTTSQIQLNGQVVNAGTCQATTGYYEFGTTIALGNQTPVQTIASGSSATFFRIIQNLAPGTTYYFRAVAQDTCGNIVRGNILNATTISSGTVTPTPSQPVVTQVVQSPFILSFGYAPLRPLPGNEVLYRIGWKNDSGTRLSDAILRVTLPAGINFLSTEDGFIRNGDKELIRPIGAVARGASGAYFFRAVIEPGVALGSDPSMGIQVTFFNPQTGSNGSVTIKGITRIGDGTSSLNGSTSVVTNVATSTVVVVTNTNDDTDGATGLAFLGSLGDAFPKTAIGWILLILAIALLLAVIRHYFVADNRPKA